MRKRVFAALLALALTLSLSPAALAEGFADVTDTATAQNVEVLRLMGVIEGGDNASFRPNSSLTRAEFCKMAVVLSGKRSVVARYGSMTIFADVKASHWAAGYINYASKDAGLIHGMPDGSFQPDRAISYGEAVTILMRQLGYKDENTGGVWPYGYIALAGEAGMTKGVTAAGGASITRAQAAKLFVNALTAKNDEGVTLLAKLGYTVATTATTLYSVDAANGTLRLSDGTTPKLAKSMASTALNGLKGYVVTNAAGEAVTFLPVTSASGSTVVDAAIVVSADKSTAGFDALTGGATNYTIYRNGVRATASALKKYDIVTYNAENNTIQACDTRVVVYYESCDPSPSTPNTVTVLGGTKFSVLTTAQQSLSTFKPGQVMVLQLTAGGQVAGAVENGTSGAQGNAFGYVGTDGKVSLICGSTLIPLTLENITVPTNVTGKAVRIAQNGRTNVYLSAQTSGASGVLDLTARTLGSRKLADSVLVFKDGQPTSLEALGVSRVEQSRITYARVNTAGEVDLIVIADDTNTFYGRAIVRSYPTDTPGEFYTKIQVDRGPKIGMTEELASGYPVHTGDFVSTQFNSNKSNFYNMVTLTKLASVPASAWIGDTAVNYGGQTYVVYPDTLLCWNRDGGTWFADLVAARVYGGTMDLYVKDGVVRAIEVRT